jgi:hypothetical protein
MTLRSMRKAARLAASDTHPLRTQRSRFGIESGSDRESKIIMVSGYAERLLAAHRMSTGPSGGCGIPFFPDDSDV